MAVQKPYHAFFCIEIKEELYIVYLHDKMYTILLIELLYNLEQSSQKMEWHLARIYQQIWIFSRVLYIRR